MVELDLNELNNYVSTRKYPEGASTDFRLFFVGMDNVHGILKHLISRAESSLYVSMYGYDDEELNDLIMQKMEDPRINCLITLDKSQAGGKHEKAILDADRAKDLQGFNTHFVIGQSATHQINHTKGLIIDGVVGIEGSTNFSTAGEGTFVLASAPGGSGYKAQNNTLTVFTCPFAVKRFQERFVAEHVAAQVATRKGV